MFPSLRDAREELLLGVGPEPRALSILPKNLLVYGHVLVLP